MTASIGKITNANKSYHLSEITDAVDSYYLADRPVRAIGTLRPTHGLADDVTSQQVLNILTGMSADGASTFLPSSFCVRFRGSQKDKMS